MMVFGTCTAQSSWCTSDWESVYCKTVGDFEGTGCKTPSGTKPSEGWPSHCMGRTQVGRMCAADLENLAKIDGLSQTTQKREFTELQKLFCEGTDKKPKANFKDAKEFKKFLQETTTEGKMEVFGMCKLQP